MTVATMRKSARWHIYAGICGLFISASNSRRQWAAPTVGDERRSLWPGRRCSGLGPWHAVSQSRRPRAMHRAWHMRPDPSTSDRTANNDAAITTLC